MTGYFENKRANNVEADPLMMVLRVEGLNKELNQGHFRFRYKKAHSNKLLWA